MRTYLLCFFVVSLIGNVYAKQEAKETALPADEKVYSEKEFNSKLSAEVEKRLKKLGQTRIVEFSKELLAKEEDLRVKELELNKSQQQLELNMKDFENKVKKFQEEQSKLLACIDDKDKEKSKRIGHLVEVISGMKPDKAASVLSVQDADIAVQILGLLEPTKVSKIFNLMDQEISARLQKQYMNMKR